VPQEAQKRAAPGSSVPHWVQCRTAGAIAVPQPMQNFAPAGLLVEQEAQTASEAGAAGAAGAADGAAEAADGAAGA
jgi:hypothetical protein